MPRVAPPARRTAVPTFVDIPLDAFGPGRDRDPGRGDRRELFAGPLPIRDALARVAELVAASARPVLVAGGDVYWAHAETAMREFAEAARVPVFVNGMGRGTLPADHELAFSRARSVALKEADLVLVAGTPLDFRLGFGRFGDARVVHLCDAASEIAPHAALAASVAGDLAAQFAALGGEQARRPTRTTTGSRACVPTSSRSEPPSSRRSKPTPPRSSPRVSTASSRSGSTVTRS